MSTMNGQQIKAMNFQRTQEQKVFDNPDILEHDKIPLRRNVSEAGAIIHKARLEQRREGLERWVLFEDFGLVTPSGFLMMQRIHNVIEFARNLQLMIEWLDKKFKGDANSSAFRQVLLQERGIMKHTFFPHQKVHIAIDHLFTLRNEEWLNGEILDSVMDMFSVQYSYRGNFIFIPTHVISAWPMILKDNSMWEWGKEQVQKLVTDQEAKAFAIEITSNHWGALCIDFTKKVILFGDSLDGGVNSRLGDETLKNVRHWLHCCGVDVASWSKKRFDVAQQPRGLSGSCGIIALNSIERCIDPSVERWSHQRSAYHRFRYLMLLTRPYK
ncbi:hypothetical protein BGZ65_004300, partial [Modicella reniformis]